LICRVCEAVADPFSKPQSEQTILCPCCLVEDLATLGHKLSRVQGVLVFKGAIITSDLMDEHRQSTVGRSNSPMAVAVALEQ
jgi:hypothetical protein